MSVAGFAIADAGIGASGDEGDPAVSAPAYQPRGGGLTREQIEDLHMKWVKCWESVSRREREKEQRLDAILRKSARQIFGHTEEGVDAGTSARIEYDF